MGWYEDDNEAPMIRIPTRMGSMEADIRGLQDLVEKQRQAIVLLCSHQTYEAFELVRKPGRGD